MKYKWFPIKISALPNSISLQNAMWTPKSVCLFTKPNNVRFIYQKKISSTIIFVIHLFGIDEFSLGKKVSFRKGRHYLKQFTDIYIFNQSIDWSLSCRELWQLPRFIWQRYLYLLNEVVCYVRFYVYSNNFLQTTIFNN